MYRLNIRRWWLTSKIKSSNIRTGLVSLQKVEVSNNGSTKVTLRETALTELRKPFQEIGTAFFTKFMGLFCSEGNRNMNGSRVCAGFLPRESVRNARVFLN
jgi:hypothetical protein